MANDQDVIASVVESHEDGQLDAEVGQDEGTNSEESSTVDWEAQAKYHQSEKDKLYAENKEIKAKVQEFLDSRKNEQPSTSQETVLKPDEFDPWEAYNDPSSKSYRFRMQEMQKTINGAVEQAVGGIQAEQGRTKLQADLAQRGFNQQQMDSFFEFADKHPSEYGLDNVIKMWESVTQSPKAIKENPLDKVRQTQSSPQAAGVLQGQQPERKDEFDEIWEGIKASGDNMKF
tara:strand:- start:1730 stop:2422 length:693 start_codon:yes stop_codon:yes gene_type:complete